MRDIYRPEAWLAVWATGLAGWTSGLAGWASGLAGWPSGGDGWMGGWTNVQMENLPMLQDFVPYRGRCPKKEEKKKISEKEEKQGLYTTAYGWAGAVTNIKSPFGPTDCPTE